MITSLGKQRQTIRLVTPLARKNQEPFSLLIDRHAGMQKSSTVAHRCDHGYAYFTRCYEVAIFLYINILFFILLIDTILHELSFYSLGILTIIKSGSISRFHSLKASISPLRQYFR